MNCPKSIIAAVLALAVGLFVFSYVKSDERASWRELRQAEQRLREQQIELREIFATQPPATQPTTQPDH